MILCIDAKRTVEERDLPSDARIVRFTKSITPAEILAIIDSEPNAEPLTLIQQSHGVPLLAAPVTYSDVVVGGAARRLDVAGPGNR